MSKLEELIQELCPNGVEYDFLCNICSVTKGVQLNKDKLKDDGLYPVINGGINPSGYWDEYNFDANLITISQGGASAGYVNYLETPFWAGAHCYVVKSVSEDMNYKYVYYLFKENEKQFMECQYGAGIPSLSMKAINDTKVPVPPMEVQSEIVRILDNFTLLTAELTAELTVRKEQFEYYREYLFSFCDNVEYKKISEISKILRGSRLTKSELIENGKYAVYHGGLEPLGFYNESNRCGDTVMIINVGASAGTVGYSNRDFWSSDGCFCIQHNSLILNKFLYYFMLNKEFILKSKVRKAGIPTLDAQVIENLLIPIIPLMEQEKIVTLLDKFDAYCNDITQGLPAEIELRQKQYEYYRDKLLTFKELK